MCYGNEKWRTDTVGESHMKMYCMYLETILNRYFSYLILDMNVRAVGHWYYEVVSLSMSQLYHNNRNWTNFFFVYYHLVCGSRWYCVYRMFVSCWLCTTVGKSSKNRYDRHQPMWSYISNSRTTLTLRNAGWIVLLKQWTKRRHKWLLRRDREIECL